MSISTGFATPNNRDTQNAYILLAIGMLYMTIMLCNAVLTNRYVGYNALFILGGTLTSPILFVLGDITGEVYGFRFATFMIFCGFVCQTLFTLACQGITHAPHPDFFKDAYSYSLIFGPSLLRINFSGFFAYTIATIFNIAFLTRWKAAVKGKIFCKRSITSSTCAELIYTLIAIVMMEINSIPVSNLISLIALSFIIKVVYTAVFAYPASKIVKYITRTTGIDVYDFPEHLTPFKLIQFIRNPSHDR